MAGESGISVWSQHLVTYQYSDRNAAKRGQVNPKLLLQAALCARGQHEKEKNLVSVFSYGRYS